jgi:cobyrinic acid a,c-diamide synthase
MTAPGSFHGVCIAGTHSGVGKTTLALGLMAALVRRGWAVQPFKCGPDYLDAGHHARACGRPARNLDTWMMGEDGVQESYARAVRRADVAVVEGVMGLFDGASAVELAGSTAHVAALLDLPVLLVVDAKGLARSIAALVSGYARFLPGLRLAGVVANNVRSARHAAILRDALAAAGCPPLLGTLPHEARWQIPERHLGLVAAPEQDVDEAWFRDLAQGVERCLDLDRLQALTSVPRPPAPGPGAPPPGRGRLARARAAAGPVDYEGNRDRRRARRAACTWPACRPAPLPPGRRRRGRGRRSRAGSGWPWPGTRPSTSITRTTSTGSATWERTWWSSPP